MSPVVGAVTIGQSPRVDIVPELLDLLPGVTAVEAGALDGESPEALLAMARAPQGPLLVTRLRDGSEIRVGEENILGGVQRGVDALQERADVILLLCTGPFPRLVSQKPLLVPDRILLHFVAGVVDHPRLGVLTPAEAQVPWQEARWRGSLPGSVEEIAVVAASPYGADWREAFREPLARLAAGRPGLVVMDCLGYDRAMRAAVRAALDVPVVVARTVLARAAAELLGLDSPGVPAAGRRSSARR